MYACTLHGAQGNRTFPFAALGLGLALIRRPRRVPQGMHDEGKDHVLQRRVGERAHRLSGLCSGHGLVRDIEGIVEVGMPCFAKGVTPNSPVRNGPGTVGAPIVIGGRAAQSGDIVVGDINGVVVVPHAMIDHVLDQLETIKVAEKEMDAKVKAGLTRPPFIEHFINSKQLKEID